MTRYLVPGLLAVCLGLGLGCAGLGGSEGGSGSPSGEEGAGGKGGKHKAGKAGDDLKVGASSIKRKDKPERIPADDDVRKRKRKEQYLVKLAPGVDRQAFLAGLSELGIQDARSAHRDDPQNAKSSDNLGLRRTIRFRTAKPEEQVIAKLEASDDVEWVEAVSDMDKAEAPNDPYWQYQWHMQMLNVPKAWKTTKGKGVVVAVVDTGVASKGQDGFFKLLDGKDFVDGDNKPEDLNGHGTHVAGTIGQAADNGVGVAGVAPQVSILPVRVLDANGSGDNNSVAEGIVWAVDHGANIINLSLGSPVNSEVVADAVAYAYDHDVTVVAATGNDGYSDFIGFPAALPTPIAVGAVDANKTVTFYSNQGEEIDICAPGGDTGADLNGDGMQDGVVQETIMEGQWQYYFLQGTSMATPHVAGVAALVYANGVTKPDQIREVLQDSAEDIGHSGWDKTYGYGLVDPVRALETRAPKHAKGKAGKGGKGKAGEGDGGLEIAGVKARVVGSGRAVISWTTSEPSVGVARGENGVEKRDEAEGKVHRVNVRGKPGSTVEFTIAARSDDQEKAKETVSVTF